MNRYTNELLEIQKDRECRLELCIELINMYLNKMDKPPDE